MASKKPSGLGRGLGALLGDEALKPEAAGSLYVDISQVESCSSQPRKAFDQAALAELADSIRLHGIIQPLTVRKLSSGYYQIIAGERRWRAARLAGLREVPVVVVEADDRKAAELAMIENLQREDLNPMEEAAGFQTLIEIYHMTQEEAATQVGKSRSAVANALRLLSLAAPVAKLVEEGKLSAGHARALVPLSPALQQRAAEAVVSGGLSVRQTEALAKRLSAEKKPAKAVPAGVDYTAEAQKDLSSRLGRGVRIVTGRKKGRIELEYYGMDDLNDLLEALALLRLKRRESTSRKEPSTMKLEKRSDGSGEPVPSQEQTGKKPVVVYIMILFIVAFLLMALSFFMHQRSNTEALGELQDSVSAMQEVQISQEQIIELQKNVDELEDRNASLEEELEAAMKQLDDTQNQLAALQALEETERLAAGTEAERQEAADRMKQYEAETLGYGGIGLRPWLEAISEADDPHSPAARYDALAEQLLGASQSGN